MLQDLRRTRSAGRSDTGRLIAGLFALIALTLVFSAAHRAETPTDPESATMLYGP